MKLSVIVPIYKVEPYIGKCLDSLLTQNIDESDYEIICINDGSPDNSKEIALGYAAKHPKIIFIDQENQGVSVARNRGLEIAKGDYIAFVDPDDTIHENSLKPILDRAYADNIDVLYLDLQLYDEEGMQIRHFEKIGDDAIISDGFTHERRTFPSTLYKRSVIGDRRFVKGIIRGQDTVFNVMVHSTARRVSYCSIPYYKYLQRETSSRQFVGTERNFISCLLAIETIDNFRKAHFPKPDARQKKYFDDAILVFIQRTLEWNVLPNASSKNFEALKQKLKTLDIAYLIPMAAQKFPMFDKPFGVFMAYRKFSGLCQAVLTKFARRRR